MSRAVRNRHHLDKRAPTLLTSAAAIGPDHEMLDTVQVAGILQVTPQWLWHARKHNYGPAFEQLTVSKVGYRRGAIRAWLKQRAKLAMASA